MVLMANMLLTHIFEANLIGAKANQLPVGLYSYSYATTPAEARAEAEWIFRNPLRNRQPKPRTSV